MTESEIFESVTGSGSTDFATVVRILNQHSGVVLIGGWQSIVMLSLCTHSMPTLL